MTLKEHAINELKISGLYTSPDEMDQMLCNCILQMVDLFSEQGHSGMSASYTISLLENILRYKPLSPLTGNDDEWVEVSEGLYQNIRCSRVFKDNSGAYDINGKVFTDKAGCTYTSRDSTVYIEFPYIPKTEYIEREV
jgi:hypothetical protein